MKWRWERGMRATSGARVLAEAGNRSGPARHVVAYVSSGFACDMDDDEPDWTDPATMGCLLYQVREWYPRAWTMYVGDTWYVMTIVADEWTTVAAGPSEAEALKAALEAWD